MYKDENIFSLFCDKIDNFMIIFVENCPKYELKYYLLQ